MDTLLFDVPDSCRILGISRSMFYKLISDGRIAPCKLGRKTLIPRECLISFADQLAAGENKPEAA